MTGDLRRSPTTLLGVACAALAVAMAIATAALIAANGLTATTVSDVPFIVVSVSYAVLGALVTSRQPRNITGWLFLFVAVFTGMSGVASEYALYALATRHGALPGAVWAIWFTSWSQYVLFPTGAIALLMLYVPDGHVPTPRWRPLAGAAMVLAVLGVISGMFAPGPLQVANVPYAIPNNPIGAGGGGPIALVLGALAIAWVPGYLVFAAAATAPVVRLRRSRGDVRQQLKWIAYAVAVSGIGVVLTSVASLFDPGLPTWVGGLALGIGFGAALPIATGVAIFKYRLYDIDLVISRTLVYGSLAVFITAVYVGIAVGIGALIGGGGKPNLGLSILATAIVAVGFQPVRERVQKVANRLVYGKRATPYEVLSQFSERVAESYAVDDVMPRMARVLAEGTGAQRADVWLRSGSTWRDAAVWPVEAGLAESLAAVNGDLPPMNGASRLVAVSHQGDLLGALGVTKRSGEALTPVEENLLTHLAGQAGLVLKNVGLTSDLEARLEDLRASRQRLVSAQDEERRRLERNLHDGAQQHLVALKVKLGLVEMLLGRDPERAKLTLGQLKGDADEALETLRDLARGIYPPLLADKGLAVAIASQARKATVPITVDAEGIGRYSQDVEAAVYFSVLEALQNIQKHAQGSSVVIRLRDRENELRFEIVDDGVGFDAAVTVKGAGLGNMIDRFDALGGEIEVTSVVGGGTTVRGVLHTVAAASG
ncbi:MAG: sensor histidine kinase [Candidatus Dormibacteraeota bacterium]|nr:sensor histidine kinase [Candidatus Dormibacteraeota bacterium]